MKKIFLIMTLLVSILAGCNDDHVFLSGEGENWKGEYSANTNGNKENGNYVFGYKDGEKDTKFENLEIIINDGETVQKAEEHKGATVKIPIACSGCAVTKKDEPIKVTIKWDNKNEETFYLK